MSTWDEDFRQLQAEFLRGGPERLADIDQALDRLERGTAATLADLKRHFHKLAGAGATYQRSQISAVAKEGERRCDALLERHGQPTADDVAQWRESRQRLAALFEEGLATPVVAEPTAAVVAAPVVIAETPRTGFDVLLVDENVETRRLLASVLQHEGIGVREAGTSAEARAQIDARLPDGLIVDVRLPDEPGYGVVEHARLQTDGEHVVVLMLSAAGDFLDLAEAIHAGADACYTKPAEIEAAHRKLLQMLERQQADVPRILVVEDDEDHAVFARRVLESAGYHVDVCSTPRSFAEHMATAQPELLLMDVNLPEVSGYDLARLVRQQEQHAALPILFLTSEAEMESRIRATKAGGDEHLTKPVHPALLASAVGARLERARFLKSLLHRDGLTRLLTHASFMEQVQQAIDRRARAMPAPATLVLFDVDHFKQVNDTYGHQAGDRVLATLAGSLRQHLRRTDIIGRYGGEEFGVLLDQLPIDDAQRLITRLLNEFATLDHSAGPHQHFRVTFSAGIAPYVDGFDRHTWIEAADQALYAAKKAGRNRVLIADVKQR
ncbi:MAG: diguanylate cyclase [Acidobacteria bacterium]|nr:diguanylate cyclase [Acidobacteriota bacterium]